MKNTLKKESIEAKIADSEIVFEVIRTALCNNIWNMDKDILDVKTKHLAKRLAKEYKLEAVRIEFLNRSAEIRHLTEITETNKVEEFNNSLFNLAMETITKMKEDKM
jgi:hypothetical protein